MNIPLDRLYHYIKIHAEELWGDNIVIYRFWPHGAKNLDNIKPLTQQDWPNWRESQLKPSIYCHDQEPLDYNYYQTIHRYTIEKLACFDNAFGRTLLAEFPEYRPPNIRLYANMYDKTILLHSEKRSYNLELYEQDQFVGAYYWSHGLIARDWFRYAQCCPMNRQTSRNIFLIYNRAWSGTREYRLKFAEMLVHAGLVDCCQMGISPYEPELGIHYDDHVFDNPLWRPLLAIEDHWPTKEIPSHYSADFDIEDYEVTDIEVVLETLFDDSRLHLTEKVLRPIACAQPFILGATHGSLEYLRSYGFQTFNELWSEEYDSITDPHDRLIAIVDLMQSISAWTEEERNQKMQRARQIAQENQKLFFSDNFSNSIIDEFRNNLKNAMVEIQKNSGQAFAARWEDLLKNPAIENVLLHNEPGGPEVNLEDLQFVLSKINYPDNS
jgi:hypothetical protein